ncbi:MAG: hypothetical protein JNM72_26645 [Deltaproteobacteria bacterium]|jgi:putative hemin transport protein|nr:hypothetical protein [Deltaproteobacteria bacterium]
MQPPPSSSALPLQHQLAVLWAADPGLTLPEAAARLQRPEALLMAARVGADVVRLDDDLPGLLRGLADLGTLTLHVDCRVGLHRKVVALRDIGAAEITAICRGEQTELRLLLSRWAAGFAVCTPGVPASPMGLHFYDRHGDSALRVLLSVGSDRAAFARLVAKHRAADQKATPPTEALPTPPVEQLPQISAAQLRVEWQELRDARDFFRLLQRHNLSRAQCYRLVGETFAEPISVAGVVHALERCAADAVPLSLAVGNRAAIHVHQGVIECISQVGAVCALTDPGHTLLLHLDRVHSAWVVHKVGLEGAQTTIELLTAHGDVVGTIRPADLNDWRWRRLTTHTALRHKVA